MPSRFGCWSDHHDMSPRRPKCNTQSIPRGDGQNICFIDQSGLAKPYAMSQCPTSDSWDILGHLETFSVLLYRRMRPISNRLYVILSEAKDLAFQEGQILRFAQDDSSYPPLASGMDCQVYA